MNRGKVFHLLAGILDILFALSLFAVIILFFVSETEFIVGPFVSFFSIFLKIGGGVESLIENIELVSYILLGIFGIIGILSLIFGSLSIARSRKEEKKYYHKGGRLIGYAVVETIGLAFFVTLLAFYYSLFSVIAVSIFGLIVILRYIGIGFFYSGRKKFVSETPVS